MVSDYSSNEKFDLLGFAKKIYSDVEGKRTYVESQDNNSDSSGSNVPAESRLNAFLRLVGLPMFVSVSKKGNTQDTINFAGNRILNPGINPEYTSKLFEYDIKDTDPTLEQREIQMMANEGQTGPEQDLIKRMTASLNDPRLLNPNANINVGTGQDSSDVYSRTVNKNLFPLVPHYIDVQPDKQMARPFMAPDKRKDWAPPFLESVIRTRIISVSKLQDVGGTEKFNEFLISISSGFQNEEEKKKVISGLTQVFDSPTILDNYILNKLFSAVFKLANEFVDLNKRRQNLLGQCKFDISFDTTSAKRDVLSKRVKSNIAENSLLSFKKTTLEQQLALEDGFLSIISSEDIEGGSTKNTTSGGLTEQFIELLNNEANDLRAEIARIDSTIQSATDEMENVRVSTDMMTGEFTGLSVPDIVAVILGFYLISREYLVALLDSNTIELMSKDPVLKAAIEKYVPAKGMELESAKKALDALQKAVSFVFEVLNSQIKINMDKKLRPKKVKTK
jgi:hypothetical protein